MSAVQPSLFEVSETQVSIAQLLRSFEFAGKKTEVRERDGVAFYFNEFWTARQRQARSIHEISYRACFKPQLPAFFINHLTMSGDTIYDPFMGRGTTIIESMLRGRHAIGNDINPLSIYLTRPRIQPPTLSEVAQRLDQISWQYDGKRDEEFLVFFHPETLTKIYALRKYLIERDNAGQIDNIDDWIRMVAINRLTGHSPGFFSVYSLPPNQAVSATSQRKINEKRNQTPPRRHVAQIILKKTRSLLSDGVPLTANTTRALFFTEPSHATPGISDSSIDLVVTSPPFLDVVQYAADNWMRTWFAGIDADTVHIAMHRKPADWMTFIRNTFNELSRVVRSGGHVAFEVGEVRNGTVDLDSLVLQAISGLPFNPIGVVVNVQEFTKTANCWGIRNNTKGTNSNRIVLVQRR